VAATLIFESTSTVLAQEPTETVEEETVQTTLGFFSTFIRTPFALLALGATITGAVTAAILEFLANIFTLFNYGFTNTTSIWEMGFGTIVRDWWWNQGVGWHLGLSILLWIMSGFFKDSK